MFMVLRQTGKLTVVTACGITTMFLVCPAYKMMGESILFMNTTSVAIFWAAWWMYGNAAARSTMWRRLLTAALFAVSFNLNSLLAFYYAVGAVLLALATRDLSAQQSVEFAKLQLRKFPELLALPIVFWVVKGMLSPATGHHAGYNTPSFSPSLLFEGFTFMWKNLLVDLFQGVVGGPFQIFIAVVATLLFLLGVRMQTNNRSVQNIAVSFERLAVCWLLLIAAAGLPYIAVGQNLAADGWLSRNSILVGMPLGMFLVGVFGCLGERLFPRNPNARVVPALVLAILCIFVCNRNILELEALGAKQQSVRTKLRSVIKESGACVIQLRDYFNIAGTIPYYPPIIWTYLAGHGDPQLRTFVIDIAGIAPPQEREGIGGSREIVFPAIAIDRKTLELMLDQTTVPSFLSSVRREGQQRMLIVQQGKSGNSGIRIGAQYLWLKWFNPGQIPDFLRKLTETSVLDLPPVGPA